MKYMRRMIYDLGSKKPCASFLFLKEHMRGKIHEMVDDGFIEFCRFDDHARKSKTH